MKARWSLVAVVAGREVFATVRVSARCVSPVLRHSLRRRPCTVIACGLGVGHARQSRRSFVLLTEEQSHAHCGATREYCHAVPTADLQPTVRSGLFPLRRETQFLSGWRVPGSNARDEWTRLALHSEVNEAENAP